MMGIRHVRNVGVVHDLPASAWDAYMPTADHPEYPSVSAGVCAAHAEASRAFLGDDKTGLEPFLFIKVRTPNPSKRVELGSRFWVNIGPSVF